jgi:hypothetical protein
MAGVLHNAEIIISVNIFQRSELISRKGSCTEDSIRGNKVTEMEVGDVSILICDNF